MRIVFFGTSSFAVPSLEQLVKAGHELAACVTQPDRPQGRGLRVEPSPVKQAAQRLKLRIIQPDRPAAELIRPLAPALGVVIAYGRLIPEELLRVPPHGMIGVHPSLLPKYRGAAPVQWAVLNGEQETGVTIFRLAPALDAGEIIRQHATPITPEETSEDRKSTRLNSSH